MRYGSTRLAAAAVLGAGSLALVACGSSDKVTTACKSQIAVNQGFLQLFTQTPALQGNGPPPKSAIPQIRANFDRYVEAPLAKFEKDAPSAISSDLKSAAAAARGIGTGNVAAFMSPQIQAKGNRIDAYFFEKCSGEKGDVKGVDYAFQGLKTSYPAGAVRFKLDNVGKENHEMVFLRRKPGVTESFAQILKLPQSQAQSKVDFAGSVDNVAPGKVGYDSLELTPGEYVAVCFIPKGSTPGKAGKGPPHAALGMEKRFSVK